MPIMAKTRRIFARSAVVCPSHKPCLRTLPWNFIFEIRKKINCGC